MAHDKAQERSSVKFEDHRPPLALVGSQISQDEEMFGQVFDKWVVRRFMTYLAPYRTKIAIATTITRVPRHE